MGVLITTSGHLHIFFNGRYGDRVAIGLPVNQYLWGMVGVNGNYCRIKSEMLSGKLDSVSVCMLYAL